MAAFALDEAARPHSGAIVMMTAMKMPFKSLAALNDGTENMLACC